MLRIGNKWFGDAYAMMFGCLTRSSNAAGTPFTGGCALGSQSAMAGLAVDCVVDKVLGTSPVLDAGWLAATVAATAAA